MDDIYSINKSRIGYAYQYKYALLIILKFMLAGRLKSAKINEPFSLNEFINLSLDIKLELMNPDEVYIYEIKTGDDFKKDKIEELKKTLRNLYLYEKNINICCKKFIIISPEVKSGILEHWNDFLFITSNRRENLHKETQKDVQNRVFQNFGFWSLGIKQKDFIKFIKQITFEVGPKYSKDSDLDKLTDLEDQIKSEVDNFSIKLSLNSSDIEIPSWTVALELLEVLNQCSENNKEVVEDLFEKLNECFYRKRLLKEARYKKDKSKILDEVKDEIKNELTNITKINYESKISLI